MNKFPPLIYYLNIDQPLVGRNYANKLVASDIYGYKAAFQTIDNRISIAAQAKDWIFFKIFKPEILEIIKERAIKVNTSLFSHTRVDLIPGSFDTLFRFSEQVLKLLFGNDFEKIIIFPEHVIPREFDDKKLSAYFFIYFVSDPFKQNQLPETGLVSIGKGGNLKGIVASSPLRKQLLHYYREAVNYRDLSNRSNVKSVNQPEIFFNSTVADFERPYTYRNVSGNKLAQKGRFDLWLKLHDNFRKETIQTLTFGDISLLSEQHHFEKAEVTTAEDINKWKTKNTNWLLDLQNELFNKFHKQGGYFETASLFCLSYDAVNALGRFFEQDEFLSAINGRQCQIDLVRDLTVVQEQCFMIRNLLSGKPISYRAFHLPTQSKIYVERLEKCIKFIENKIF